MSVSGKCSMRIRVDFSFGKADMSLPKVIYVSWRFFLIKPCNFPLFHTTCDTLKYLDKQIHTIGSLILI